MRVAVDTVELPLEEEELASVEGVVQERVASPIFAGASDLRVRLRKVKGALLCVAAVGLAGGGLATSTATSSTPLDAVMGALDGLPDRIDRARRISSTSRGSRHAAVRAEVKKLLREG